MNERQASFLLRDPQRNHYTIGSRLASSYSGSSS